MTVKHRAGRLHLNADGLSRLQDIVAPPPVDPEIVGYAVECFALSVL